MAGRRTVDAAVLDLVPPAIPTRRTALTAARGIRARPAPPGGPDGPGEDDPPPS